MRFWLLSELFYPIETSTGYVMTKIAEQISNKVPVNVICGPDKYTSDTLSSNAKLPENIILNRVNIPDLNKDHKIKRALRMIILSLKMAYKLFLKVKRDDTVMIVTNPAPLLLLVALVKRFKRFNLIIIVHDVFPENILTTGMLSKKSFIYGILSWLFNRSYRQADHIIVVGEDMKELLQIKTLQKIKCTVITNWADVDEIFPLAQDNSDIVKYYNNPQLKNKIIIQFAGNIGRVQALKEFIEVFHQAANPDVAFVLIGSGALKDELTETVKTKGIENVFFYPTKSRSEQNTFLNSCDIGLVTLNKGMFGLGVPSKTYNVWAAGKPVLFVGDKDSEIARNIRDHNTGWAFTWETSDELIDWLKSLKFAGREEILIKGLSARKTSIDVFQRSVILEKYNAIFS